MENIQMYLMYNYKSYLDFAFLYILIQKNDIM